MPFTCCVPGCRGNYPNGINVSTFKFPKDKLINQKWILAIRRKDFNITEHTKVCELHFKKTDIETEISAYDSKTGRTLTAPLSNKRLKAGVIPSIFPPPLNPSSSLPSREDPEEKRIRIEKEQLSLALQKSLKENGEISQPEDAAGSRCNSRSPGLRLTEDNVQNPQKKGTKRKKKSDKKESLDKEVDNISNLSSEEKCQSSDITQSHNMNGLSNCKVLLNKVQIKEEKPWEKEYNYQNNSKNKSQENERDKVKIVSVESFSNNKNAESTLQKETISESCDATFYKKPLKIDKRDEAFGNFVACEISDIHRNPELYLKTQQSILKVLVEAHFELMSTTS